MYFFSLYAFLNRSNSELFLTITDKSFLYQLYETVFKDVAATKNKIIFHFLLEKFGRMCFGGKECSGRPAGISVVCVRGSAKWKGAGIRQFLLLLQRTILVRGVADPDPGVEKFVRGRFNRIDFGSKILFKFKAFQLFSMLIWNQVRWSKIKQQISVIHKVGSGYGQIRSGSATLLIRKQTFRLFFSPQCLEKFKLKNWCKNGSKYKDLSKFSRAEIRL